MHRELVSRFVREAVEKREEFKEEWKRKLSNE